MRVIAGQLSGRNFDAPKGQATHPMSTKARGGLFNILGDIEGLSLLDAFGGSGALSFEAISRGAASSLIIEVDRRAQDAIAQNIKALDLWSQVKLVKANASSWSDQNRQTKFDLVIAAPPYDKVQLSLVQRLTRHVADKGLFILDWPPKLTIPELAGLQIIKDKNYGDAELIFYRPI